MEEAPLERRLKVVIVGNPRTGKTSLPSRFVDGVRNMTEYPNSGYSIYPLRFNADEQNVVEFNCWDFSMERIAGNVERYLVGCDAAIIMADVTSADSFSNVRYWYNTVKRVCGVPIPMSLCGNKVDADENRQVTFTLAKRRAQKLGIPYSEISARSNFNVLNPFKHLELRRWDQMRHPPALIAPDIHMDEDLKNQILRRIVGL